MALSKTTNFVSTTVRGTSLTSGTISTAVNDVVIVSYSAEDNTAAGTLGISNTGTALSWTQIAVTNTANNCKVAAWLAKVATAGNITVTVTTTNSSFSAICTDVYTGAHLTTPVPAGNVFSGVSGTDISQSITPTATGSMLRMVAADWSTTNSFAAIANCTLDNIYNQVGGYTGTTIRPSTQPLGTGAFSIGETDTAGTISWLAFEIKAEPDPVVTPSQAIVRISANIGYAGTQDPTVSSSQRISVPWQNISTRGKTLGHFWLDTVTASSTNATTTVNQASISIIANSASASATSTATAAQASINITGALATASTTGNVSASVNNGVINLIANNATATGTSPNASVSVNQGTINLVANSATVLLSATATAAQPQINIIANSAAALTSTIANVSQASINIAANAVTASSTATATGAQASINLVANNATASATSGGNASVSVNQAGINIAGASVTASATENQSVSVSNGVINLIANNASALTAATINATQAQLNVVANNASTSAETTANANQGAINLIANTATASGTSGGNVSVSVNQAIINIVANNVAAIGDPVISSGGWIDERKKKPVYDDRKKQRKAIEEIIQAAIEGFDDIPEQEVAKVEKEVLAQTEKQDFTDLIYAAIYARNLVEEQIQAYLDEIEDEEDFMLLL